MKLITAKNINLVIVSLAMICVSWTLADALYSAVSSDDYRSDSSTAIFSPGYVNYTMQQTASIINQVNQKKNFWEYVVEYVQNNLSYKVAENAQDNDLPELKKKTGSGSTGETTDAFSGDQLIDSTQYDVQIGAGRSQTYDSNGRLLSEVFNDMRHFYVGFSNAGTSTIQEAINLAREGDAVLVRGGNYSGYVTIKNGVRMYGGYNDLGKRNILATPTIISNGGIRAYNIDKPTEINGFYIKNPYGSTIGQYRTNYYGIDAYNTSDQLRILNNTIESGYMGIYTYRSNAIVYNNDIYGCSWSAIYTGYSSLIVTNNRLHNTTFGITETYYSSSTFQNNVVWGNYTNFIIHGRSTSVIDKNTIYGGTEGIRYHSSSPVVTDNLFVNTSSAMKLYDTTYGMGQSDIIASGNVFYGNRELGINTSILSQGLNQENLFTDPGLIDPTKGFYSSTLLDKGFSTSNITTDYNKVILNNAFGQNVGRSSLDALGKGLVTSNKGMLSDGTSDFFGAAATSFGNKPIDLRTKALGLTLKDLLVSKRALVSGDTEEDGDASQDRSLSKNANEFALAAPLGSLKDAQGDEVEAVLMLASILRNPTEDQKAIIDVIEALLKDVEDITKNAENQDLSGATDNILQVAAAALLAQAIPDLLKEGDVANIKNIFSELDMAKGNVMREYQESTKPYYEEIKKILAKNMAILQLKDVLSKQMTEEEVGKLSRSEIDKIMDKIRKMENKAFEEEYMLQEEAKYRAKYLDPHKKTLEEHMKVVIQDFTQRLSGVLGGIDTTNKTSKGSEK